MSDDPDMKSDEPDMTNKLGVMRFDNVRKILARGLFTKKEFSDITEVSVSTLSSGFGATYKTAPSDKTMGRIEAAFGLSPGTMDKPDFSAQGLEAVPREPEKESLPEVIKMTEITIQIGRTTIRTEVTEEKAESILRLVIFDE